jgi:hypothetical protein
VKVADVFQNVKDKVSEMAATTNGAVDAAAAVNVPAKTFDTILVLDFGYARPSVALYIDPNSQYQDLSTLIS